MSKRKGYMLGLIIPREVSLYLKLYSFINDLTVSQVIRSVVDQWMRKNEVSKSDLINSIITKMKQDWVNQTSGKPKDTFLKEWRETLSDLLSDEELVNAIIQAYINKYEFVR